MEEVRKMKVWQKNLIRIVSPIFEKLDILDWEIKKKFYSKTAKKIAEDRKKYMGDLIKRFFQEWAFKK